MASNITAQSVLERSLGLLECPICSDRFKQPKLLECSHSFCLECLLQLSEKSLSATTFSCPVCWQETLLKENGIDGLKTNFTALSLLEDIVKQETQLKQQQGKQLQSQEYASKCSKHTGNDLIVYCKKCKKMICTTCITNSHQSHSLLEINEVSDKCKHQAEELIAKITKSIETSNIAIQEIHRSRKTLDSMFAATKEKISKKADEEKQKLMQEAEQIYKDRVKTIETALATKSKERDNAEVEKDNVIQIMDQESCEIVHRMEKLSKDLKEYKQVKSTKVPDDLTYMDFKESQKSLGRVLMKDEQAESATSVVARKFRELHRFVKNSIQTMRWTLKSEMEVIIYENKAHQIQILSPLDIAAYTNSDIVVLDKSLSFVVITEEGNLQFTVIPQELPIEHLNEPSIVTVNKNDELIVLDNKTVKIFHRNYQLLHQFNPESEPSCIAVDDNDLIAVGYHNKAQVSLYKPDGSLIRTLPAPGIDDYLTTYKQQLIYTNRWDTKLVSLSYNSKPVFSVDIKQDFCFKQPCGICCDKEGSIFVAVYFLSCDILHYSPDGNYIGCIIKGIDIPRCIIFTPADDLVVATDTSVQIYHRELRW